MNQPGPKIAELILYSFPKVTIGNILSAEGRLIYFWPAFFIAELHSKASQLSRQGMISKALKK